MIPFYREGKQGPPQLKWVSFSPDCPLARQLKLAPSRCKGTFMECPEIRGQGKVLWGQVAVEGLAWGGSEKAATRRTPRL